VDDRIRDVSTVGQNRWQVLFPLFLLFLPEIISECRRGVRGNPGPRRLGDRQNSAMTRCFAAVLPLFP
jgi:hypothetical protein